MNVMTERAEQKAAVRRPLEGRTAIVTGSTSGIGLGIAAALAAGGAAVMLNGFGEPSAIRETARKLGGEHGVEVDYDGADLSRPAAIEDLVALPVDGGWTAA